ncbi:cobalamin-binding protein [Halorussus vallis]|nr:cobalamin-binding protein [Halorussus vallis]USZ75155.1 cobalamin-binding protein [Halorussus vallis]
MSDDLPRSTAEDEARGDADRMSDTTESDTNSPSVVSLAPSATETARALGATDRLVGVTHHCELDASARTESRENLVRVGGWLNPDYDAVDDCDPDLVLTADDLQADVAAALRDRGHEVVHFAPTTLGEVVESFAEIGAALGVPRRGHDLAWRSRSRLDRVRRFVADFERPVVYCEEWSEPPMAAGNWVPEAVEAAGGRCPFVAPGERSREISRTAVETAAPEHVVLHVCGRGDRVDPSTVADRGWDLPAVEAGNVHVVDDSLLNQPSPRLIEGVETLATKLHPGLVGE